ncbi:tetratricopeptide repeat protein [Microcoleus vaginatus]|uniref:tetratricopeptide repeat protein n=1 Tax=Microcoleus vaginatus TaxID=119532 RepID=UPI00020D1430|nr:Tetratricopeptide TPR_1 repeat-containing protein [Microcoleus vaginatus FGP-2]
MKIGFLDTYTWDYNIETPYREPLGGTQSAICYLAEALAAQGNEVFLLNNTSEPGMSRGVDCRRRVGDKSNLELLRALDFLVIVNILGKALEVKPLLGEQTQLILWIHNEPGFVFLENFKNEREINACDAFVFVSDWQREQFHRRFGIDSNRSCVLRNAIAPCFANIFADNISILSHKSRPPILAYTSTPFRGLDILLKVFPEIRLAVPGTRLKVFSSMKVHQIDDNDNKLFFGQLYRECQETEGVEYIGSVPQPELVRQLRSVAVLAYPNTYLETSSIAVMEAMASGCRIVTSELAALPETTAGFARLVSMSGVENFASITNWKRAGKPDWEGYTRRFLEAIVGVLNEGTGAGEATAENHLRQQVEYINRGCTWSVRAREWVEWLNIISVKTVRVAEQMITESLVDSEAAQAYFVKGNRLKDAGDLGGAIENYQKALELNPGDAEVHKKLAEVYVLQGEFEKAIASCNLAIKFKPDFAAAYLTMGNAQHAQGQLEMAIQAYLQALEIQPKFAEASANLGSMYYKLGQLEQAANYYQKALAINPQLSSVNLMLGSVLQQQEKLDAAIACYQKVLQQQPGDASAAEKLSSLLAQKQRETTDSNFIELETESGEAQPVSVNKDEGYGLQPSSINLPPAPTTETLNTPFTNPAELSEQVTSLNVPDSGQVANFKEVEPYKKLAENFLVQGKIKDAIAACQQAIKIRPDFIHAYVTLGNALQAEGKNEAAIRSYSQALELRPNFAEVRANIGSMYFKMGRLEEAIAHYQQAIALNPDLAGAHWNLGKVYQKHGNIQAAIACFKRTSELNPQLVGADFHFNLGNRLFSQGKRDEAIECYEKAIAIKPDWAEAYGNIGSVRSQQGNLDAAIAYYQKAVALKPQLEVLHFNIANSFLQQNKYDEAITNYRNTLKIKPDWPEVHANLGSCFSMLGRLEEALASYQQALALKPDWAEVYCRMGHIQKQDKPLEAIANFEKAIQCNPKYSEAYQQLCDLLSHSTNLAGARSVADKYCENCGENALVMSATAYVFSYLQSGVSKQAIQKLEEIESLCYEKIETFSVIELKLLYEIFLFAVSHLRDNREKNASFYRLIAKEYYQKAVPQRQQVNRNNLANYQTKEQRPLKIGFLSKHFRRHSVGWCSEALIRELSHITPHVHLYVTGKLNRDEVTQRFEDMAGKFYWPKKYPNGFADGGEIFAEVAQDNLDVLIDLDSMTVPTNVEVLYQYPAGICVSWLGFDAPYISDNHYFLCDEHTHPPGVEKNYLEQLVRLPVCSVAIGALQSIPVNREAIRNALGIGLEQMTYLCVAPGRKTNPEMVRAQVTILKEVPESVLIRKGQGDPDVIHSTYRQECEIQGVDFGRIKFIGQTRSEEEHRAIYYVADVLLDSYPYNGGTHNLEALWANLPVVTRSGDQYLSRMGYAFLKSANLDVGAAWTWEEYTQWGVKFGRDAGFRNAVKEHLVKSKQPEHLAPLWNPKKLAEDMYEVFQKLLAK